MNQHQLHQDLSNLSPDELTAFSDRLGIPYSSLGGKSVSDKAGSLMSKMERNGRLPELIYLLLQARPELQAAYQAYPRAAPVPKAAGLDWLDRLAAGEGEAIEEPPTMKWDSKKHPRDSEQ
jgi:hypothetical protein